MSSDVRLTIICKSMFISFILSINLSNIFFFQFHCVSYDKDVTQGSVSALCCL